jgi:hypothetical protein
MPLEAPVTTATLTTAPPSLGRPTGFVEEGSPT